MTAKRLLGAALAVTAVIVLASNNIATGAATNRAGVVVRYSEQHVERMCVAFDEPAISGLELLERADVPYLAERSALGSAICKIGDRGCNDAAGDCFCEYPTFWGYWSREGGEKEWTFSDVGASDRDVTDGDLNGWSWGKDGKPAPSFDTFADVCPASANGGIKATSKTDAPARATASRPNYIAFLGLAVLFLVVVGVLQVRRRRV